MKTYEITSPECGKSLLCHKSFGHEIGLIDAGFGSYIEMVDFNNWTNWEHFDILGIIFNSEAYGLLKLFSTRHNCRLRCGNASDE